MTVSTAQLMSLPALYRMTPSRYKAARRILRLTAPVTLIGFTEREIEMIEAGARAVGRSATRRYQAAVVRGFGPRRSACLTIW